MKDILGNSNGDDSNIIESLANIDNIKDTLKGSYVDIVATDSNGKRILRCRIDTDLFPTEPIKEMLTSELITRKNLLERKIKEINNALNKE